MSLKNIPFGEIDAFHVIVEVPTGSQKKYDYDPKLGVMKLTQFLYDEARFPFNYGYIPETKSGDGNPLDVFLLSTHPITQGTVVESRAIAMIEVMDDGEEDHKIIAIPLNEVRWNHVKDLKDLPVEIIPDFEEFYESIAEQWQRDIKITGFFGKDRAVKELLRTQILD